MNRLTYRRSEVMALYGVPARTLDGAIRRGDIRTKHYGRAVYLLAEDCDRLFNPKASAEVKAEDREELREVTG